MGWRVVESVEVVVAVDDQFVLRKRCKPTWVVVLFSYRCRVSMDRSKCPIEVSLEEPQLETDLLLYHSCSTYHEAKRMADACEDYDEAEERRSRTMRMMRMSCGSLRWESEG